MKGMKQLIKKSKKPRSRNRIPVDTCKFCSSPVEHKVKVKGMKGLKRKRKTQEKVGYQLTHASLTLSPVESTVTILRPT